jgi:hypothetical protein
LGFPCPNISNQRRNKVASAFKRFSYAVAALPKDLDDARLGLSGMSRPSQQHATVGAGG